MTPNRNHGLDGTDHGDNDTIAPNIKRPREPEYTHQESSYEYRFVKPSPKRSRIQDSVHKSEFEHQPATQSAPELSSTNSQYGVPSTKYSPALPSPSQNTTSFGAHTPIKKELAMAVDMASSDSLSPPSQHPNLDDESKDMPFSSRRIHSNIDLNMGMYSSTPEPSTKEGIVEATARMIQPLTSLASSRGPPYNIGCECHPLGTLTPMKYYHSFLNRIMYEGEQRGKADIRKAETKREALNAQGYELDYVDYYKIKMEAHRAVQRREILTLGLKAMELSTSAGVMSPTVEDEDHKKSNKEVMKAGEIVFNEMIHVTIANEIKAEREALAYEF